MLALEIVLHRNVQTLTYWVLEDNVLGVTSPKDEPLVRRIAAGHGGRDHCTGFRLLPCHHR